MPKIIMFLAFCQNWSQFYQAEALKNPVSGLKRRKKSFTEHETFRKQLWIRFIHLVGFEPVEQVLRSLFSCPSPTILQELKNAPYKHWNVEAEGFCYCCFVFSNYPKTRNPVPDPSSSPPPLCPPMKAVKQISQVGTPGEPAARLPCGCCLCLSPAQGSANNGSFCRARQKR